MYAISWWSPGRHTGHGPKGYKRGDDRIKEDVSERLEQSGQIDAHEIEVEAKDGNVTLRGTVPDRQMKRMAEDLVESCSGVKDVRNELRVESHDHSSGQESELGMGSKGQSGQPTSRSSDGGSGSTSNAGTSSSSRQRSSSGNG